MNHASPRRSPAPTPQRAAHGPPDASSPSPARHGLDAATAEAVDHAARLATYPPPYPSGWYVLARSSELRHRPLAISALGRRFVAFRDAAGRAVVLDRACPHMGADLADGRVQDGNLVCPFHGWSLDGEGRVCGIPYADRVAPGLRARSWQVEERYGLVLLYFADVDLPRREAPSAPYPFPRIAGIDTGRLRPRGRYDAPPAHMHLVELAENSVDDRHFDSLHARMRVPWLGWPVPGVRAQHHTRWEVDPTTPHVAWFHDHVEIEIGGKVRPALAADASVQFVGPGGVTVFTVELPRLGEIVLFHAHTPIAPLLQRPRFLWFADRGVPRPIVSYVVGSWIAQWRQDLRIWESKDYLARPMVIPQDGPVHALRRWYAQFYPPSPTSRLTAGGAA